MDTIFVKNVREDGPAHQAGLRTGERGHAGLAGSRGRRGLRAARGTRAMPCLLCWGAFLLVWLFFLHSLFFFFSPHLLSVPWHCGGSALLFRAWDAQSSVGVPTG